MLDWIWWTIWMFCMSTVSVLPQHLVTWEWEGTEMTTEYSIYSSVLYVIVCITSLLSDTDDCAENILKSCRFCLSQSYVGRWIAKERWNNFVVRRVRWVSNHHLYSIKHSQTRMLHSLSTDNDMKVIYQEFVWNSMTLRFSFISLWKLSIEGRVSKTMKKQNFPFSPR